MTSYLLKNGEVLCDLRQSEESPLPTLQEGCWHACTVIAPNRVEARPPISSALRSKEHQRFHSNSRAAAWVPTVG